MAADRLLIFAGPLPARRKAAAAYEADLRETIGIAARERGRVEVWHVGGRAMRRRLEAGFPHVLLREQTDGNAGRRLSDAFRRSFQDGAERVVVLLGPAPSLLEATLTSAFHDLHEVEAVLGPAAGGGCYLVGLRDGAWRRAPDIFDALELNGEEGDLMLHHLTVAGLSLRVLPGIPVEGEGEGEG